MKKLYYWWWLTLFIKLLLAATMPISSDETYYWVWSKNMQLSYFDHPPMVSWLLWLGHLFEPLGNAVRWPTVLVGHLTMLIWIKVLNNFYDIDNAKTWFWLAIASPLLGIGSIIAVPDVPVVFFWSLSIFVFLQLMQKHTIHNYALLGFFLGLGFCAKYHIVLLVLSIIVFIVAEKRWKELNYFYTALSVCFFVIGSSPVLIWNYQNDFLSFKFQLNHGFGQSWKPEWTASYIAAEFFIIFPLIFYAAIKSKLQPSLKFLYYCSWVPVIFFLISSFRGPIQMNWPIVALPSIFVLAAVNKNLNKYYRYVNGFWFVLIALLLIHVKKPFLGSVSTTIERDFYYKPLLNLRSEYQPLYFSNYHMASYVWYKTKVPAYKLHLMSRIDFFDSLSASVPNEDKFYLVAEVYPEWPSWIEAHNLEHREVKKINADFVLYEFTKPSFEKSYQPPSQ